MNIVLRLLLILLLALRCAPGHADSASLMAQVQTKSNLRYQFAVGKNAEIRATSDNRAFFIWWQPSNVVTPKGVIVTLHGHQSYATDEFYLWQPYAEKYGYAILALQWWFGGGDATSDYYTPKDMYPLLAAQLQSKGITPGTVLLHGYSRGSANSYAVAALDAVAAPRYFGMILSVSGQMASGYPPNQEVIAGTFGSKPYTGVQWVLYCGEKDADPIVCPAMRGSRDWVAAYGATVALFIDDATGDHGGFMLNSTNVEAALAAYGNMLASKTSPPVCTLSASPVVLAAGSSSTLKASCTPAANAYTWTNTGFASTAASGTVSPTSTTLYSVVGNNAAGNGNAASAAVYVCNTPPTQNYSPLVLGGSTANDQLTGSIANDSLDGAAGIDTVIYNCNRSSFTVTRTTAGWTVSSQSEGLDTLSNVERLRFGDETLALDISGNAGQAYRLYQAAFNRTPDNGGLKYWIGQLDAGMALQEVAARFIDSNEFRQLYGTNPNNADFLTRLYNNVLHRTPDAGGYAWWLDQLDAGTHTQTTALMGFSESPENQAGVLGAILNGIDLLN